MSFVIAFVVYQWYHLGGLRDQTMRQLLIVLDQVANVHVTKVSLQQCVLAQLVSTGTNQVNTDLAASRRRWKGPSEPVYENIVESELEQKRLELFLHLEVGFLGLARGKDVMRRHGSAIHFRLFDLVLSGRGMRSRTGEGGLMVGD